MIYVTSDLHGYPLNRFLELLESASFDEDDVLYVLGDVIDRNGDGGVATLAWMAGEPNVRLLLGNHEAMLLACAFLFDAPGAVSLDGLRKKQRRLAENWLAHGAQPTIEALNALRRRRPEAFRTVFGRLSAAPMYEYLSVDSGRYLLVHAGLDHFAPDRPLDSYSPDELMYCRPAKKQSYFRDVTTIFGHTPTRRYGAPNRLFRTPTWIDIDTGAGAGGAPMLLRLDDLHPYYARL